MTHPQPHSAVTFFAEHPDAGHVSLVDGTLTLVGDIDSRLFELWSTRRRSPTVITAIDATGVTHLGSAGLVLLARLAEAAEGQIRLRADARAVWRPLQITGLAALFLPDDGAPAANA